MIRKGMSNCAIRVNDVINRIKDSPQSISETPNKEQNEDTIQTKNFGNALSIYEQGIQQGKSSAIKEVLEICEDNCSCTCLDILKQRFKSK